MRDGWIKIHRVLLDSDVFESGNEKLLRTWIWVLLKASHKERSCTVGLQTIDLKPGQFVTGRKKAAAELGYNESMVYRHLKALEQMGNISIEANNKYSVVTVANWGKYQSIEDKSDQQTNSKRPTNEQQPNTNNNVKNLKKFVAPTVEEVSKYCDERKNFVNPESFIDFYEARGWMIGKCKMKDWKAAVRTWERNARDKQAAQQAEFDYREFGI